MENANIFINGKMVAQGVAFQRVPTVGELVSGHDGYHRVAIVGHSWAGPNQPIVNLSLDPGHSLVTDAPFPPGPTAMEQVG